MSGPSRQPDSRPSRRCRNAAGNPAMITNPPPQREETINLRKIRDSPNRITRAAQNADGNPAGKCDQGQISVNDQMRAVGCIAPPWLD